MEEELRTKHASSARLLQSPDKKDLSKQLLRLASWRGEDGRTALQPPVDIGIAAKQQSLHTLLAWIVKHVQMHREAISLVSHAVWPVVSISALLDVGLDPESSAQSKSQAQTPAAESEDLLDVETIGSLSVAEQHQTETAGPDAVLLQRVLHAERWLTDVHGQVASSAVAMEALEQKVTALTNSVHLVAGGGGGGSPRGLRRRDTDSTQPPSSSSSKASGRASAVQQQLYLDRVGVEPASLLCSEPWREAAAAKVSEDEQEWRQRVAVLCNSAISQRKEMQEYKDMFQGISMRLDTWAERAKEDTNSLSNRLSSLELSLSQARQDLDVLQQLQVASPAPGPSEPPEAEEEQQLEEAERSEQGSLPPMDAADLEDIHRKLADLHHRLSGMEGRHDQRSTTPPPSRPSSVQSGLRSPLLDRRLQMQQLAMMVAGNCPLSGGEGRESPELPLRRVAPRPYSAGAAGAAQRGATFRGGAAPRGAFGSIRRRPQTAHARASAAQLDSRPTFGLASCP